MADVVTLRDLNEVKTKCDFLQGASIAFGVFDGVHRGHVFLIDQACKTAREDNSECIIVTFDKDPDELFGTAAFTKLMANADRIAYLSTLPVQKVLVLPFTQQFASLSPEEFLEKVFSVYTPRHIHIGGDFRFGYKAQGDVNLMHTWACERGMQVHAHSLLMWKGEPISATRIRSLLLTGDIAGAVEALGHEYRFSGEVVAGRGEGKTFGIRTANIVLPPQLQALREGVYAAWVFIEKKPYKAAINMGYAASFENAAANCEAHILDFNGDMYGKVLYVQPIEFLREQRKFDSVDELIATIQDNIKTTRRVLQTPPSL